MGQLRATNGFMQDSQPWLLTDLDNRDILNVILHVTMENLRICAILLQVSELLKC